MENLYTARIIRPSAFSHLTDNAFCLQAPPPIAPPPPPTHKNCTTLAFRFSWVLQSPQKKLKTMLVEVGQKGVFWEMCKWQMDKRQNMDFKLIIKDDYLKLK